MQSASVKRSSVIPVFSFPYQFSPYQIVGVKKHISKRTPTTFLEAFDLCCSPLDHSVKYKGRNEVWEGDPFELSCILPFNDKEGWTLNSSILIEKERQVI
ncbi:hypothetical protein CEXT_94941 [Caerostris extrusa]|uniref:Uncharacterized protein n=1 Tax=Caerostris extrusa TaxID=172846 RepID=A0AAV4VQ49_CAEEX|nr:hypothetical protein CEXT_94941 [Caerostris extrusa]